MSIAIQAVTSKSTSREKEGSNMADTVCMDVEGALPETRGLPQLGLSTLSEVHGGISPQVLIAEADDIKNNFWYRQRAVICAVSVLGCWALGMLSTPVILEDGRWDWCLDAAGMVFFGTAVLIRLWATLYIGGRKAQRVICEGPYSVCRNPLYWGTFMIVLSQACFFHSLTVAAGLIVPVILYCWGVVPAEERHLTARLGAEYLAYCEAVSRWRPNFRAFRSPEVIDLNVNGLKKECYRILGWAWLPLFAEAMNHLREMSWWPHPFSLL